MNSIAIYEAFLKKVHFKLNRNNFSKFSSFLKKYQSLQDLGVNSNLSRVLKVFAVKIGYLFQMKIKNNLKCSFHTMHL